MLFEQHGHFQVPGGIRVHMRQLKKGEAPQGSKEATNPGDEDSTSRRVRPKIILDNTVGGSDDDLGLQMESISHHQPIVLPSSSRLVEAPLLGDTVVSQQALDADALALQTQDWAGTLPAGDEVQLTPVKHLWDKPGLDISAMDNMYLQPASANNPAYDAFYSSSTGVGQQHRMLLQYTVSERHGVRARHIIDFLRRLSSSDRKLVKLVFVIPASPVERYLYFQPQPWLGAKGQVRLMRTTFCGDSNSN